MLILIILFIVKKNIYQSKILLKSFKDIINYNIEFYKNKLLFDKIYKLDIL